MPGARRTVTGATVLGLVLDTRLRQTSNDRLSLDDVMRRMYQRWGSTPYPDDAFADSDGFRHCGSDRLKHRLPYR